ncbi:MAG: Asp23/Gls24 family envelope stress response protein [Oscillospiraceae bacterium]|nr:Asp23/Gls24 family envelope stress response protein [Oscillospiraceae bacterium]
MNKTSEAAVNCLKISEEVIAKIAEAAVNDIDGVCGFSKAGVSFSRLFKKAAQQNAISIKSDGDFVEVSMGITVYSGCKVKSVAEKVQRRVKDDIQSMTGIAVTKVNVRIDGIIFENE